ncbi:hypothetical protein B0H19DRAFT_959772, partial [Mycena capillaripes]
AWVEGCDQLKIPIKAKDAAPFVDEYRARMRQKTGATSNSEPGKKRTQFSNDAFVNAIVKWIVGDDQSINVIENEQLRNIFLLLRSELRDSDIPHRTKIRKRIIEVWDEHLAHLESEMAHLATAFLHIIDRIDIASRASLLLYHDILGWVTLDNALNNDTFMSFLEMELRKRKIPFRKLHRRIR